MSQYITAIDLGTCKVSAAVAMRSSSGIKVIGYVEKPSSGVIKGEVVNIKNLSNVLCPLIDELRNQVNTAPDEYPITIKNVYVSISGNSIKCCDQQVKTTRSEDAGLISAKEIDELKERILNEFNEPKKKIYHIIPQSYNVDDHIGCSEAEGMDGCEIEGFYKVFSGKSSLENNTNNVISRCGLVTKALVFNPIATSKAILSDEDKELGVAMVDIGGGTTNILICKDHIIRHCAVLPFGGNLITKDIIATCSVAEKYAEKLKKQHGSCLGEESAENRIVEVSSDNGDTKDISLKSLNSTIEARMSEIIMSVMHIIEQTGYADKLGAGLVITGGTANINHLKNLVRHLTDMPVRIAIPSSHLVTSNSKQDIFKPGASTVVGLLLTAFEEGAYDGDTLDEPKPRVDFIEKDIWGNELNNDTDANDTGDGGRNAQGRKDNVTDRVHKNKKKGFKGFMDSLFGNTKESDNEA